MNYRFSGNPFDGPLVGEPVTDTPLLDQLDALGAAGVQLLGACEQLVDQAAHELRIRDRERYVGDLERRVTAYLADHPGASANDVHRAVGGTRAAVLAAVRAERRREPCSPNHPEDGHDWRHITDGIFECRGCHARAEAA